MYNKHFWKSKYSHLFLKIVNFFTFLALITAFFHFLSFDVGAEAVCDVDGVLPGLGDRQRQIQKAVERQTLVAALHAFDAAAELAFEQVRDDRVVSFAEVLEPDFGLHVHRLLVAVDGFVFGLFAHAVQFVVHAVQQKSQKLLGVLLAIPAELLCDFGNCTFQVRWCDVC